MEQSRLLTLHKAIAAAFIGVLTISSTPARAQLAFTNPIEQALIRSGVAVTAAMHSSIETSFQHLKSYARTVEAVDASMGARVILCAKAKIGFYFKGELGVCSALNGTKYVMTGSGLGLSVGGAAEVFALVYFGRIDIPLTRHYAGLQIASSATKGSKIALKIANLIKIFPKGIGPDFAVYSGDFNIGKLLMLGVQAGPMIDISGSMIQLRSPSDAFRDLLYSL